ncbi:hypothetical protein HBO34_15925 [Pseudomonas veronii]|uniref:hypothetical protein n=1 Tax=Pseudomonas veronii TaxID=76761 RepID=UPI0014730132|nr:hypothetical protein [Pseudomonas veronii]NMX39363.1 hypothetical protein [Pseudomonas veronii]
MSDYSSTIPDAGTPIFDVNGYINPVWHNFFFTLLRRTGGTEGNAGGDNLERLIVLEGRVTDSEQVENANVQVMNTPDCDDDLLAVQHGVHCDPILHDAVTASANGFMIAADKVKLDSVTSGAAVASVSGTAPITSSGGATPTIAISAATPSATGSMSAADKTKLDAVVLPKYDAQELIADVTAVNTTADTPVISYTVAANSSAAGTTFSFRMVGLVSCAASAGALSVWLKVGGTKLVAQSFTMPTSAQSNVGLYYEATLTVRSLGTSGVAQIGTMLSSHNNVLNAGPGVVSTAGFMNTTVATQIQMGFNWSVANAANSVTASNASIVAEKQ